jgi:glycosyltransferase involved in cell wall biosynthesis
MRIAILGTRGIPASYGGFETFAEQLSTRLARRGHQVTVYCRSHHTPKRMRSYQGVELVVLPTLRSKHLDTLIHTFLSTLHAMSRPYDAVLFCNAANAMLLPLARLRGARVAINVDGLEWRRRKWGPLARWLYRVSERLACWFSHALITDAQVIQDYYLRAHGSRSWFIPYGTSTERSTSFGALERYGLEPRRYFLYVGRLEPENNADRVLAAFERLRTDLRLAIVGDAPYARQFVQKLHSTSDPRVVFTGFVFGEPYRELISHAFCTVHATEVGGTHPALLEAMGLGNGVLVHDVPENREVARDAAVYFSFGQQDDLLRKMESVLAGPSDLAALAELARERVRELYDWERVTDEYEALFTTLAGLAPVEPLPAAGQVEIPSPPP